MSIDVSIIIPIYKNANSLSRCLDSILAQDFKGTYEAILCVDDSGDGSLQIAEDYANRYPNKIVLHHPDHRMGLSLARQEGFDLARGEYIYACDADDELKENALRVLVDTIRKYDADLVNCSFYTAKGSKEHAHVYPFRLPTRVFNAEKAVSCFMMDATFRAFLWTKLFRASLLKCYPRIVLTKKGVMFEDLAFVSALLANCKKVVNIPTPLYYYYQDNPDSEASKPRSDRARWHLSVFASVRLYFDRLGNPKLVKAFRRKKIRIRLSLLFDLKMDKKNGLGKEGKKECLAALKAVTAKEPLDANNPYFADYVKGVIVEKDASSVSK